MRLRLCHFAFALLVFALLSTGLVYTSTNTRCARAVQAPASPNSAAGAKVDSTNFQEILDTIDPASLHEVLHSHLKDKYQDGVYREDKTAMEVVHQQDAEMAESLIELARRQSTNTTVVTTTPTGTTVVTTSLGSTSTLPTSVTVVTSTPPTSQAPTSTTTSNKPTSPSNTQVVSTSTAPTQVSSSTKSEVSGTTTTGPLTTSTQIGSSSAASISSGGSSSSLQTSTGTSNSPIASTSDAGSSTSAQASSTTPNSITQEVVFKTTLTNGAISTVTSVTVVPGAAGDSDGGSSSKTNTAIASLQTGAASRNCLAINAIVGAFCLIAVAAL